MKRFRFKLDPVLQQRKWIEEQRVLEYAQSQRQEATERERLGEITQRCERCLGQLHQATQGALSVSDIRMQLNYLETLEQRQTEQTEVLQQAEQMREKAHSRWQKASIDLKVLDRLREHAQQRHTNTIQAEEQKVLDDIGTRALHLSSQGNY